MSRLTQIYEGWKNYIFQTPEIEQLAKERMAVCAGCTYLNFLNICSRCTCPKSGKARSPESRCPENLWEDGWGQQAQQPEMIVQENQIPFMVWNEELQDFELKK